jgi:hypothetical protein
MLEMAAHFPDLQILSAGQELAASVTTTAAAAPTTTAATAVAVTAAAHGLKGARLGSGAATSLLARLLIIRDALDVFRKTFLFAHLLKPPEHLFGGFIAARLHFDHERDPFGDVELELSRTARASAFA